MQHHGQHDGVHVCKQPRRLLGGRVRAGKGQGRKGFRGAMNDGLTGIHAAGIVHVPMLGQCMQHRSVITANVQDTSRTPGQRGQHGLNQGARTFGIRDGIARRFGVAQTLISFGVGTGICGIQQFRVGHALAETCMKFGVVQTTT